MDIKREVASDEDHKLVIRALNEDYLLILTPMSQAKFDKAVSVVQSLPKDGPIKPTQDDQLFFYKYYKQATVGDVNVPRPGMLDFTGKAKWDAWKSVEGTSKEEAWSKYVEKLLQILKENEGAGDAAKYIQEIESA